MEKSASSEKERRKKKEGKKGEQSKERARESNTFAKCTPHDFSPQQGETGTLI